MVVDQEYDPETIRVYGSSGPSWTDTYQIDFSWSPVERLDLFATFRYTDSEMTIRRSDGRSVQVERPLVSRYKTLLNSTVCPRSSGRWVFDGHGAAQRSGPHPDARRTTWRQRHSPRYPMFYAQVSRKVGRFDIYVGCENIADYRQEDPILNWENPYDYRFNSMNVWGPLMGRKFYAGLRFNLY